MAQGGATLTGYAYFFVIGDSHQATASEQANLDHFKSIFEQKLGFKWANQDRLVRNLTRGDWDHNKLRPEEQNHNLRPDQCCMLCHMKALDFSDVEYLMIGICSHGNQYENTGKDFLQLWNSSFLYVVEILNDLNDTNFPALKDKKRILVLDFCRHDSTKPSDAVEDCGKSVQTMMNPSQRRGFTSGTLPMDGGYISGPLNNNQAKSHSIHRQSSTTYIETQPLDFLVVYGTTPGRVAYNSDTNGSWMLRALNETISEHNFNERPLNFLHALTKAAQKMSQHESFVFQDDRFVDTYKSFKKSILYTSSSLQSLPIFHKPVSELPLPATEPLLPANEPTNQDLPTNYSFFETDSRDPYRH